MKFVCDSCGMRYHIADQLVRGKIVKIRCKRCKHILEAHLPREDEEDLEIEVTEEDLESQAPADDQSEPPSPAPRKKRPTSVPPTHRTARSQPGRR